MTLGISKKYALWFGGVSLILLSTVLLTMIFVISRSSHYLRERMKEGTIENFEAVQYSTMTNLAEYLRRELFTPLYELDIESITLSIKDLRRGLPVESVLIADASGKVLTDGTWENPSYGLQLNIDQKKFETAPVRIERVEGGRRVIFVVGIKEYIAGYGEIIFSDAPLRKAIVRQDKIVARIWTDFRDTFVKIAVVWSLFIGLLAVLIGSIFSRTLSRPLIQLRDATGRIAKGDLDYGVEIRSRDEFGELAASFNKMVMDLRERTTELARANTALQSEIAERKKKEETIMYQASHDLLTDLPNRMLFMDLLKLELAQARRRSTKVAVLFLDLDRFKSINDTLGHDIGDKLLKEVASRLKAGIRNADTAARIGGDEFNIILADIIHSRDIGDIARKVLEPFHHIFDIDGHTLHATTSIGISIYPEDGEHPETLLKNADIALYHVKQEGGDGFQFYDPSMNTLTVERMILETNLRQTLERGELVLYYQPQVDIKTRKMVCAEALLRWEHPKMGLLEPNRFIPIAEETGFIMVIDDWVLRTVCAQIKAWQTKGLRICCITVNISARQFQNPHLVENVSNILREAQISPDCLDLEVTESMAMSNVERTAARLRELSSMGVHVSIDDFGTGYSSLNYLKRLPIERLKIDKSFVQDIATDPDDRAIISAVTAMAHNMKMKVIAEGVETEDQLSFLVSSGCDEMQGYLFSRPLSAKEFEDLVRIEENFRDDRIFR